MISYSIFYIIPQGYSRRMAVGYPSHYPVFSSAEIVKPLATRQPVYVSISLYRQKQIYPTAIFFDFDCEKPVARSELQKLKQLCISREIAYSIVEPRRGYHFYIHIRPEPLDHLMYSDLADWIVSESAIEHYDDRTDGNINQIARLPGSYYPEIGRRVKIIEQKLYSLKSLFDIVPVEKAVLKLMQLNRANTIATDDIYRPCIEYWIKDVHPSQLVRFAWCAMRIMQGRSDQEILQEAAGYNWEDFDVNYTTYQIRHIRRRGYYPPSCGLLRKEGYCLESCCKWRAKIKKKEVYK